MEEERVEVPVSLTMEDSVGGHVTTYRPNFKKENEFTFVRETVTVDRLE